jgi:flagellar basal body-associated protein FliL
MNKQKNRQIITIIIVLIIIVLGYWFFTIIYNGNKENLNNVKKNNNIEQDNKDNKNSFNFKNDEGLTLRNPQANEIVSSPINIEGEAVGSWYFEANFSVKLVDKESGNIIAQSYVTAQDNWMTEDKVEFNSILEYETDEEIKALLILESANPSGLEENQMTYRIPVTLNASN